MPSLEVDQLLEVCASATWAQRVAAGGPYPDVDALLEQADRVLASLPAAEIDAALAGHPRIGGPVDNPSSAREQAGVVGADRRILAPQQTLYEMGKAVLEHYAVIAEVRLSRPIDTISATTCRDLGWKTTTKCSTQATVRTVRCRRR